MNERGKKWTQLRILLYIVAFCRLIVFTIFSFYSFSTERARDCEPVERQMMNLKWKRQMKYERKRIYWIMTTRWKWPKCIPCFLFIYLFMYIHIRWHSGLRWLLALYHIIFQSFIVNWQVSAEKTDDFSGDAKSTWDNHSHNNSRKPQAARRAHLRCHGNTGEYLHSWADNRWCMNGNIEWLESKFKEWNLNRKEITIDSHNKLRRWRKMWFLVGRRKSVCEIRRAAAACVYSAAISGTHDDMTIRKSDRRGTGYGWHWRRAAPMPHNFTSTSWPKWFFTTEQTTESHWITEFRRMVGGQHARDTHTPVRPLARTPTGNTVDGACAVGRSPPHHEFRNGVHSTRNDTECQSVRFSFSVDWPRPVMAVGVVLLIVRCSSWSTTYYSCRDPRALDICLAYHLFYLCFTPFINCQFNFESN